MPRVVPFVCRAGIKMSQNPTQALGLRESRLDSTLSTEPLQITEAAGGHNHSRQQDARQIETAGKRAATLIGQAVLQLPIWGTVFQPFRVHSLTTKYRLRNDIWRVSGVLQQQLDFGR